MSVESFIARTNQPGGGVHKDIRRRSIRAAAAAKRLAPKDTGRLQADIHVEMVMRGGFAVGRVGTDLYYAKYVRRGTGIYGPSGQVIRPKRGRYLVFVPKGQTSPVFARQVKGQRGVDFLGKALPAARG